MCICVFLSPLCCAVVFCDLWWRNSAETGGLQGQWQHHRRMWGWKARNGPHLQTKCLSRWEPHKYILKRTELIYCCTFANLFLLTVNVEKKWQMEIESGLYLLQNFVYRKSSMWSHTVIQNSIKHGECWNDGFCVFYWYGTIEHLEHTHAPFLQAMVSQIL